MKQQPFVIRKIGIVIGCAFALFFAACTSTLNSPQQLPTVIMTAAATSIVSSTATTQTTSTPEPSKDDLEIEQIKIENEKLKNENDWWWVNKASIISSLVSTLGVIISTFGVILAVFIGFFQWHKDQKVDREKRDEGRFQAVVEGLGSERVEARVGAAIMLRTFLRPGYEQFYSQAFDLAVSYLRLRKADPDVPEPLDSLSQALITVLKESFPQARGNISKFTPESLDATGVHLDNAYLSKTDLSKIRLRGASLRGAYFWMAQLQDAYFKHSNLEKAYLGNAHLERADLGKTVLTGAILAEAYLNGAHLWGADFTDADLTDADFTNANLTKTNPENAKSLQGTILRGVVGLSTAQLAACVAKGAIVDDANST